MKRLAMMAAIGLIAFASPVDLDASGATPAGAPPARSRSDRAPVLRVTAPFDVRPTLPREDLAAVRAAEVAARQRPAGRATRSAPRPRLSGDGVWAALAQCESNRNPRAISKSGTYRGAFQFSAATWHSLGYGGDPIDHPYAEQLAAAKKLQARSGWDQWPSCARQLGLR